MRRFIKFLLVVAMMTVVCAASMSSASTKLPSRKKSSKTLHMHVSAPAPLKGEGITTSSGLTYWDIETGAGEPAVKGKIVKIRYKGWNPAGKEFANSSAFGEPSIFRLGTRQLIPGWDEGIEGMRVGGKRQLQIPSELAYGQIGLAPLVMPNATVYFEIELIGVQ
jgi:FKBP-type peptidyl-prolyl cis-trans isomerase FkpA